jgi:cytochrome b-561
MEPTTKLVNFRILYLVTQLIGVFMIIFVALWIGIYLNGFGWDYDNTMVLFNWHPMLMSLGMVFLYGNCE